MEIVKSILTKNPCYKNGEKIKVKGIMFHSTCSPQPSAKVLIHNWNRPECENKCVHALINAIDGTVYQTLPWNHKGRHCGRHPISKKTANDTHIGIEMCEPAQIKYKDGGIIELAPFADTEAVGNILTKTYNSAVELCAKLCSDFGLDPNSDIISHTEGYEKGIASNKSNPEHLWTRFEMPYTMDTFRSDVINQINANMDTIPKQTMEIRIEVSNLRIRTGPGTNYNSTGKYTGKGNFNITEIQNGTGSKKGWGKLKSINGWVCLDYVEMLSNELRETM